jgi:hypothetical protein
VNEKKGSICSFRPTQRSGITKTLAKRALEEGENNPSSDGRAFVKAQAYATLALLKAIEIASTTR